MATVEDLLSAIKHVNDCSSDSRAWQTGLTPQDVTDVATMYLATPQRLDALLGRSVPAHPQLFGPTNGGYPRQCQQPGGASKAGLPTDQRPTDHQEGVAADAIKKRRKRSRATNSSAAQLDLQVISAILNAHLTAVDGKEALTQLQRDVESAVRTRTDLDTAAGARDFQRFLLESRRTSDRAGGRQSRRHVQVGTHGSVDVALQRAPDGMPEPTGRSAPPAADRLCRREMTAQNRRRRVDPRLTAWRRRHASPPSHRRRLPLPHRQRTVPNVPVTPSSPGARGCWTARTGTRLGTAGDSLLPDLLQASDGAAGRTATWTTR